MKKTFENINRVLADWNPIGVDEYIVDDEYQRYIPSIIKAINDKQKLMVRLEDILVNKMGVEYDPSNEKHSEDLQRICEKIMQAYKEEKS